MHKYTLSKTPIGSGGYSTVYQCKNQQGTQFACKVMPKRLNHVHHVNREVHVMRTMYDSPNIVRCIEFGEDTDNFYIVQELCQGGDVFDYVLGNTTNTPPTEETKLAIVRDVLEGLQDMHAKGIVHADIKSNNIFLQDVNIKIGDFGTAIFTHNKPYIVNKMIATPWFMAPENMRSILHTSSDVWSVGIMTYHLLTGRLPFNDFDCPSAPDKAKIWKSILLDAPKFSNTHISPLARQFIENCLIKDYTSRPTALEALSFLPTIKFEQTLKMI